MTTDQVAQLIYLMVLLAAIGGSFLLGMRKGEGARLARHGAVWGLIFIGAIAAIGLWSDIRSTVLPRQEVFAAENRVVLPRRPDGHFHLTLKIGGTPVDFLVDTGASNVVLSRPDAERLGIDLDALAYFGTAMTANGAVRTARVRLSDVWLGEMEEPAMTAWVTDGEMPGSLLGMDYLRRFDRIEIAGDRLVLNR